MKTVKKKDKIISDADIEGPMMIYNPLIKTQEKELGQWVAERKLKLKTKELKNKR